MSLTNENRQIGRKNGETEKERQTETDRDKRQQIGQEHALSWSGGEDCLLERRARELSMVMEISYILFWIIASWAYTIAKTP